MIPPKKLNVLDRHGGYTSLRRVKGYERYDLHLNCLVDGPPQWSGTCWRPGSRLSDPMGTLVEYDEDSFYQSNNNCTMAIYRLGRRYAAVWFNNTTKERVA